VKARPLGLGLGLVLPFVCSFLAGCLVTVPSAPASSAAVLTSDGDATSRSRDGGREAAAPESAPPPPPASGYVEFFAEPNFRGDSFTVEAGAGADDLARLAASRGSWNDRIASFRIQGVATVQAFSDAGFRGERLESSSSLADLVAERRRANGATWDHAISSLRVVPARSSPFGAAPHYDRRTAENIVRRAYRDILVRDPDPDGLRDYREKLMDGRLTEASLRASLQASAERDTLQFDDVITKAYREILHRDPDPDGLKHYHQLMAEKGWTEPQLRADLLRSVEQGEQAIRTLVTRAYRDILGRDPDPDGYAHYAQLVRDSGWTDRQVRDALLRSSEYRQKAH
jgi:hypothetical protein